MHPNHIPKKFPWYQDRLINQYDKTLLFGDTGFRITFAKGLVYENMNNREPAWKTIMVPGRMKRDQKLAENCPQPKRHNSKTATDCFPLGTWHYRSWGTKYLWRYCWGTKP